MSLLLADAYLHRMTGDIVRFSESFAIKWYGMSYLFGFFLAWMLFRWMAKTKRSVLTPAQVDDLVFAIVLGILVGGRVGYAIFYDPGLLVGFSSSFPFYDLFAINKGGMASHGGMIGVIVGITWWAVRRRVAALPLLDISVLGASIGLSIGRLANFVNGELWGKPLPDAMQADPPAWSITYAAEVLDPTFDGWVDIRNALPTLPGDGDYPVRIYDALMAGDETVIDAVQPHLTAYYPSQLIQALTDGPILFALLAIVAFRPRKPGVVGAWFLIGYGALRIASEVFRQPDDGVALLAGLSRGQVLSIVMVLAGVISLIIVSRRDVERTPALLGPAPTSTPSDDATDDA